MSHVFVRTITILLYMEELYLDTLLNKNEGWTFYDNAEYFVGWPNHVAICRSGLQYI